MKLKLTLQRQSGPEADIVVTADAGATVADVAAGIRARDPYLAKLGVAADAPVTLAVTDPGAPAARVLDSDFALAEAPVASGASIAIVPEGTSAPTPPPAIAAKLVVVEGPDAGTEFPVVPGTSYLGRDATMADLILSDPLVSKRHARVDVFSGAIRLVDLNSANGLEVDGGLVTRVDLEDGDTVRVGDSVLRAAIAAPAAATETRPVGPIAFNRSPRVETRYPGQEYATPAPPSEQDAQPFPWLALVAPLLVGVVGIFFMRREPAMLLLVLTSPLLMFGTWFGTRQARKRKRKLDIERFNARAERLEATLAEERERERAIRRAESPTTAEVYQQAVELGPLLWTRRPEHWQFLSVNLGIGTMASRNVITTTKEDEGLPEYVERAAKIKHDFRDVSDVPVTENLYFSGALGIAGPQPLAADAARGVLVQLTGLHSPAELVVAAVVSNAWTNEFEWLKWLPHTASPHSPLEAVHLANSQATGGALLSAIEELIDSRTKEQELRGAKMLENSALVAGASAGDGAEEVAPPPAATPAVVLLISDDAPVDRARLVQVAERAADAGVYPVWVSATQQQLPAVARTYLSVDSEGARVGLVRLGDEITDVRHESVTREQALWFAKRLAPVTDAGALVEDSSDLPRSIMMLSLVGPSLATSPSAAIGRWRENDSIHDRSGGPLVRRRPGKLRAIVGSAGVDAMHLDLRTQGPHALVGGTTGSGKSEFLQAWVLGMAAEYSPDRVTFLFVDYKGGSAFADCVHLPHCVGLVTDLSPHLVRRALTSLRAELHYREHLFNRKKAKDLLDLEKRGDPDAPPALVLVIDEFAALAGEVPEFVDGVVDIAQRGRSLGIHLIMATQRPAGVIKDNLRANTNLRIALRMADESDSMDVVGDKIAGTFDPSIPGRGIAKTGPGRLTPFQSAYAGGWTSDTPAPPSVDVAELRFGAEHQWELPGRDEQLASETQADPGPTDQARLVANLVKAAAEARIPAPRRPWLDELAPVFDLTRLHQRTDAELVLGVVDLPQLQKQQEVVFRPDVDGHIAYYGASGAGKTVALRTLAAAAGITPRGGPVDVYGLDFATGGLRMLEALPHVGSIVSGDDPERVVRLLRMLRDELERRSAEYTAVDAGTIGDYRRIAGKPDERRILLLVDNFPSFKNEFEIGASRAPWYGVFQQLLAEGRGLGMHVAITADRPGSVPTGVASAFQRRIALRLADEAGYMLLDAPADILSATSPPGRAVIDGAEAQLAIVGGQAGVAEQAKALAALGEAIRRTGRGEAAEVGTLGTEIPAATLSADVDGKPVLGISDDTLQPIGFEAGGVFVLGGPPASGRTNALRWLVASVERAHPKVTRYYFGSPRSAIGQQPGWEGKALTVEDAASLAKEVAATVAETGAEEKILVVIEQIGDFLSTSADSAMVEMIKAVKRSDHLLIAENESGGWGSSWPLLQEVKSARTGFLLQPESMEGDTILKTSLPRVSRGDFPPGRGFFIARGKAVRVQLPLTEGEAAG
ncbi:FHA domain-containing protein [Protaetiibacter sp. SSC-01]|uniref:FtsK/SpoIIIE domain-containing protein n=1 Tax=Protaetiibacter sp. SSC-01 TaxID=2759943 RepID=UPI001656E9F1|nr:FtsK/SpoIIIE domain-containing protein [Protaetiibacter sp. SSC-01]QNO38141.1 FHA domain-containing protein [Protaetiibacter sp. SSC-01]